MLMFWVVAVLVIPRLADANCMANESNTLQALARRNGINFGVATDPSYMNSRHNSLVSKEFNMLVAENAMKMDFIYTASGSPGQGSYDWSDSDTLVEFARENNMKVRGHALLWHNAIPEGFESWTMTQQEWRDWVTDYITTVVRRYKGDVVEWDVVNEVYVHSSIDGESGENGLRNSFWLRTLGPDYVEFCFRAAHAADTSAKLYYNDYAVEWDNPKTEIIYNKLVDMKRQGVPVHGMGFQTHISYYDGNVAQYRTNFQRFAKAGFELSMTEVDIFQDCLGTDGYFEKQAEIYGEFIKMAIELKFVNFLVWGLDDGNSWVNSHQNLFPCKGDPLLFDSDLAPKPAYFTVKQTMCDLLESSSGGGDEGGTGDGTGQTGSGRRRIAAADFDTKNGGGLVGKGSWILYSNNNFIETELTGLQGQQKIIIKAEPRGTTGGGPEYPILNIFLDGERLLSRKVRKSPTWAGVVLDEPLIGDHTLRLTFSNDGEDRDLVIVKATIKGI